MATAGTVVGVVALSASPVPGVNVASLLLGPVGLVLSVVALVLAARGRARGRGLAVAGVVTSTVAVVVAAAVVALCLVVLLSVR